MVSISTVLAGDVNAFWWTSERAVNLRAEEGHRILKAGTERAQSLDESGCATMRT
jgi:hypothetical protein